MPTPPVQYVTSDDGYDIAYTMHGDGPTLVCLPVAFSHAQQVWSDSSATPLLTALSDRFRLVYYDSRGQGLSQRGLPGDLSLDAFVSDLRAVLDRLNLRRVTLFADNFWSHIAVRMAVEEPDRIGSLVLMHCSVSFGDQVKWFLNLAGQNWDYYLDVQVGATRPPGAEGEVDLAARVARKERLRSRTTQADWLQTLQAYSASDLTKVLPKLRCPALVLHPLDQQWVTQESATRVAASIPNGRFVSLGGSGYWGDPEQAGDAIEAFLIRTHEQPEPPTARLSDSHSLSERQVEVLSLIAGGKTNREIASELVLSLRTVERHVNDIYARLGVRNRSEAVAIALKTLR